MKDIGENLRSDLMLNSMVDNASFGLDFYLWYAKGQPKISKGKLIEMLKCGVEISNVLGDDYCAECKELKSYFQELISNVENDEFASKFKNEEIAAIRQYLFKASVPFMIHAIEILRNVSSGGEL